MAQLPTVKVRAKNSDGYTVINESDFDEKKHELFDPSKLADYAAQDAEEEAAAAEAAAKAAADKAKAARAKTKKATKSKAE